MIVESALVVPVPEAEPVVGDLRARYDPAPPAGLPAHITVVYPFLDPAFLNESILADLAAIFAGVTSFRFALGAIARFPDVVYLVPNPTGSFIRMTAAVATRWPEAPPYGGRYEEVVPHLTVAHTSDETAVEEITKSIVSHLPIDCTARQIWLLTRQEDRWSTRHRFELGDHPAG